jgi:hypothetical protein
MFHFGICLFSVDFGLARFFLSDQIFSQGGFSSFRQALESSHTLKVYSSSSFLRTFFNSPELCFEQSSSWPERPPALQDQRTWTGITARQSSRHSLVVGAIQNPCTRCQWRERFSSFRRHLACLFRSYLNLILK